MRAQTTGSSLRYHMKLRVFLLFGGIFLDACGMRPLPDASPSPAAVVTVSTADQNDGSTPPRPSTEGRLVVSFIDQWGSSWDTVEPDGTLDGGGLRFPRDVDLAAFRRCRTRALMSDPEQRGWSLVQASFENGPRCTDKTETEGLSGETVACICRAVTKLPAVMVRLSQLWWVYVKFL